MSGRNLKELKTGTVNAELGELALDASEILELKPKAVKNSR